MHVRFYTFSRFSELSLMVFRFSPNQLVCWTTTKGPPKEIYRNLSRPHMTPPRKVLYCSEYSPQSDLHLGFGNGFTKYNSKKMGVQTKYCISIVSILRVSIHELLVPKKCDHRCGPFDTHILNRSHTAWIEFVSHLQTPYGCIAVFTFSLKIWLISGKKSSWQGNIAVWL